MALGSLTLSTLVATDARAKAYSVDAQLGWDELPDELSAAELGAAGVGTEAETAPVAGAAPPASRQCRDTTVQASAYGATLPPWSAAHAYTHLYDADQPVVATVTDNMRVTEVGREYDTHHIVLDLGKAPFPVLEGQSIGIVAPGVDAAGRPHRPRQYSVASARHGERPGFNNLSLSVKRVLEDRQGKPVQGAVSNYLCDLKVGAKVKLIGPFGTSFLMPNHPGSHLVMVCTGTGTGAAPMRAMIRWRHHLHTTENFAGGLATHLPSSLAVTMRDAGARHPAAADRLEYGHPAGAQMKIRVEAFQEMLESVA
jgi:benzoyl-CoA 2,3-dioxygenase component A